MSLISLIFDQMYTQCIWSSTRKYSWPLLFLHILAICSPGIILSGILASKKREKQENKWLTPQILVPLCKPQRRQQSERVQQDWPRCKCEGRKWEKQTLLVRFNKLWEIMSLIVGNLFFFLILKSQSNRILRFLSSGDREECGCRQTPQDHKQKSPCWDLHSLHQD